ncbi:phenylacetate-CoA oxygenase subunit PaaJ [bacterium SCSIO 12741]|nr:phenylacetate-CoA oxygenase subunit PaaJ [bacterium SCSIO 12741]
MTAEEKQGMIQRVRSILNTIPDPEIPVISIVELGVIRGVSIGDDAQIIIDLTPTYSGCPATEAFMKDIRTTLGKEGYDSIHINTVYDPAWTTEWMSDEAREKLRKYGIAPPEKGTHDKGVLFASGPKSVACPQCDSRDTQLISQFGSTACKSLYKCNNCLETFDYFKCI